MAIWMMYLFGIERLQMLKYKRFISARKICQ